MKLNKSKQFLADAIHACGKGWPDGAHWAAIDEECGGIKFCIAAYAGEPRPPAAGECCWRPSDNSSVVKWFDLEKCVTPNWHQTALSREEYFSAYPAEPVADADGWIEWKGGECPVGIDEVVDVMQLDGRTYTSMAVNFHWRLKNGSVSVARYRLHKPEVKSTAVGDDETNLACKEELDAFEFCESVMRSIPEPELDDVESRLAKALELVKAAAPHMLSDKYKFDGDEVMGERKPTIEQLAADYRNKLDCANRKQQEADEAKAAADAALGELVAGGQAIGLAVSPITAKRAPKIVKEGW